MQMWWAAVADVASWFIIIKSEDSVWGALRGGQILAMGDHGLL